MPEPDPAGREPAYGRPVKCVMCKHGQLKPGKTSIALDAPGTTTVVFVGVPARICGRCGEAYMTERITGKLLRLARGAAQSGVERQIVSWHD